MYIFLCRKVKTSEDLIGNDSLMSMNNGQWPSEVDGGGVNRYGAGTFKFTSADSDNDGMPDIWEDLFDLDKNDPDDAGEDTLDMDGLTNLEEFENGKRVSWQLYEHSVYQARGYHQVARRPFGREN